MAVSAISVCFLALDQPYTRQTRVTSSSRREPDWPAERVDRALIIHSRTRCGGGRSSGNSGNAAAPGMLATSAIVARLGPKALGSIRKPPARRTGHQ